MITDKKMLEIFRKFIEMNKEILKESKSLMPTCIIIREKYAIECVGMPFKNSDEKEITINLLKKHIASKKTLGYFLCMDTKVTIMNQKDSSKNKVMDALVHSLFTKTDNLVATSFYELKNNKIKFTEEREDTGHESVWNLWETTPFDEKATKEYYKFKTEHPEKYGGTI